MKECPDCYNPSRPGSACMLQAGNIYFCLKCGTSRDSNLKPLLVPTI